MTPVSFGLLVEALEAAGFPNEAGRVDTMRKILRWSLEAGATPDAIIADLEASLRAAEERNADPFPPLDLADALAEPPYAWCTGIPWWDQAMPDGGMQEGWKIVIAAPPGCGKTSLVMQIVRGFLRNQPNARALYMNGEMSRRQLVTRMVQQAANIPAHALHMGNAEQTARKDRAVERLETVLPRLGIMDPPIGMEKIQEAAYKYPLIVVDYLHLCRPVDISAGRVEQLDQIMADLTSIAATSGSTFLVVSGMSRADGKTTGRNIFEAFKGSSQIEYAADLAYVGEFGDDLGDDMTAARWRCLKNRHGPAVDLDLEFHGPSMRFERAKDRSAVAVVDDGV